MNQQSSPPWVCYPKIFLTFQMNSPANDEQARAAPRCRQHQRGHQLRVLLVVTGDVCGQHPSCPWPLRHSGVCKQLLGQEFQLGMKGRARPAVGGSCSGQLKVQPTFSVLLSLPLSQPLCIFVSFPGLAKSRISHGLQQLSVGREKEHRGNGEQRGN